MSITTAFTVAFEKKKAKNWEKIYVLVDIHDTILRACYENEETYDYFPQALEALRMLSARPDVCLILWTGCYPDKMESYLRRFETDGIHFDYANENPEVGNTPMACFDGKLYFNVGIDDKFGFEPETDWAEVMEAVGKWPLAND